MNTPASRIASLLLAAVLSTIIFSSCRTEPEVVPSSSVNVGDRQLGKYRGFYLLNEGNMGSNKCTLDYYDYEEGIYYRNIYAERNPSVVMELGDVGNDMAVYDGRLYIVVNCSHKVEVLDARTAVRIGQVDIPNCRFIKFVGDKAYVSSYVGPVEIGANSPKGAIYEFDLATLRVTRTCTVGYQPEQMAVVDGKIYVANSGGYNPADYDRTVSVVDIASMTQLTQIEVGINLYGVQLDSWGRMWVSSRGDYKGVESCLYLLEKQEGDDYYKPMGKYDTPVSAMAIDGAELYYLADAWSEITMAATHGYGILDLRTLQLTGANFITDGTEAAIKQPYGLAVNDDNGDIFVMDAKNYVSSGTLYCFDHYGVRKWSVTTGDIPRAITFVPR